MRVFVLTCLAVCSVLAFTDEAGNVGSESPRPPSLAPVLLFPALDWSTVAPMLAPRRSTAAARGKHRRDS